jgi:hypothetical protein
MEDVFQQILCSVGTGVVLSLFLILGSSRYFNKSSYKPPSRVLDVTFSPGKDDRSQEKLEKRVRKIQKILGRTKEEVQCKLGLDSMSQRTRYKNKMCSL